MMDGLLVFPVQRRLRGHGESKAAIHNGRKASNLRYVEASGFQNLHGSFNRFFNFDKTFNSNWNCNWPCLAGTCRCDKYSIRIKRDNTLRAIAQGGKWLHHQFRYCYCYLVSCILQSNSNGLVAVISLFIVFKGRPEMLKRSISVKRFGTTNYTK